MAESQKITSVFLTGKGKMRLQKAFFKDGTTQSYPRAKNFNSFARTYDVTAKGLAKRVEDLKKFAADGGCLLKGELDKILEEEPRAGHSLKNKRNRTLLLDIDKFPIVEAQVPNLAEARAKDAKLIQSSSVLPSFVDESKRKIGRNALECIAEYIVSLFNNEEMQNASYTVHASSSMGILSNDSVSMHIEFILSKAVSPEIQTTWLQCMNYYIQQFSRNLQLSANGLTLKYPLDISVTSNAKLIFIAHPYFEDSTMNPIDNKDRIFYVEKKIPVLDAEVLNIAQRRDAIQAKKDDFIKILRKQLGLAPKKAKTTTISRGGSIEEFLKNPDSMDFDIVDDSSDFVHINVNSGDSNAYWFPKNDPSLVYNFKDEPIFRMEDANVIFYEECLRRYAEFINAKKGGRQLIRRVQEKGGSFVCIEIDETEQISQMMESKDKAAAADWGIQYGLVLPESVGYASLQYNPHLQEAYVVEIRDNLPPIETINTFRMPETLRKAERKASLEVEPPQMLKLLQETCPATLRVIAHVLNDKERDVEHFINWIITAAVERKKTGTTWLMQGVQGTGKGVMWEHIIQPMFGRENSKKITIDELEDKFNANMRNTTMILVDEFRHSDAAGSKKLENKLKLMATEAEYSMRAMHQEYAQQENFFNMIFFSNNRDAMRIEESDRRINVGSRQENRLEMTLGNGNFQKGSKAISALVKRIHEERETFSNIIVSAVYCEHKAKQALHNEAKDVMREASSTRMEDFARTITQGHMRDFLLAAQDLPESLIEKKASIQSILLSIQHQEWGVNGKSMMFLTTEQLTSIYSVSVDKPASSAAMKKYIKRHVSESKCEQAKEGKLWGFNIDLPINEANKAAYEDIKAMYILSDAANIQNIV